MRSSGVSADRRIGALRVSERDEPTSPLLQNEQQREYAVSSRAILRVKENVSVMYMCMVHHDLQAHRK